MYVMLKFKLELLGYIDVILGLQLAAQVYDS